MTKRIIRTFSKKGGKGRRSQGEGQPGPFFAPNSFVCLPAIQYPTLPTRTLPAHDSAPINPNISMSLPAFDPNDGWISCRCRVAKSQLLHDANISVGVGPQKALNVTYLWVHSRMGVFWKESVSSSFTMHLFPREASKTASLKSSPPATSIFLPPRRSAAFCRPGMVPIRAC